MIRQESIPSIDRLREAFRYSCGRLFWRIQSSNRAPKGSEAGTSIGSHGYRQIRLDGHLMLVHRVVWALIHGRWPEGQIDHANGTRTDNRISNLRETDQSLNNANCKKRKNSGSTLKGATKIASGRYAAQLNYRGQKHYLGSFDTEEDAHKAYMDFAERTFGEFARAS